MTDHSPTDNETPRQTLERIGEARVRFLLQPGGPELPAYLWTPAHEWLAELDAAKEKVQTRETT